MWLNTTTGREAPDSYGRSRQKRCINTVVKEVRYWNMDVRKRRREREREREKKRKRIMGEKIR